MSKQHAKMGGGKSHLLVQEVYNIKNLSTCILSRGFVIIHHSNLDKLQRNIC
jgi:hypothetical protein